MTDITPPANGLDAYTYAGWTVVVPASGQCTVIGPIAATFATAAKAIAWIDARRR